MTLKTVLAGALVAGATLLASAAVAGTTVITVNGDADIFAAGLGAAPASNGGGGSLPPSLSVTGGETLQITATGSINCCDTSPTSPGPTGPDGFTGNPFGGSGSDITNSTGSTVGEFIDGTGSFPLVGVFNVGGETPFVIGSSDTVLVPVGATALYFGLPDAAGLNGASGFYADNSGSFSVSVTPVPEPGMWAIMLTGLAAVGAAARRSRRLAASTAPAV